MKKEVEEEDTLLLAASQHYEKRCSPLMSSEDIHSAVLDQVPLNTKRSTKKCHFSSARLAGVIQSPSKKKKLKQGEEPQ